ncbi:hypothetical protein Tco_0984218 [Tanacetum coccineum]
MRGILSSKECQLNKRGSFSRMLNIISGTILIFFELVGLKSIRRGCVCMGKKLLIFSKLVMKDPSGAIIVPILLLGKYLMPVSIGPQSTKMPMNEPVLLNSPLTDKVESFAPEDDIDEIDAFLAMEVSSNFEEGYFDSEGDVIFLENLLSDDTTHNLAPEISTSRSQENVHANPSSIIESLPTSLIPVEDNDPVQEEIDIFLVPDDLIPPGVENDDSEDEDNELPNLDHQDNPSSPRPPPEPPDVCLNFKPATAMNDEDFNQGEIVLSLNVEDVNSFTFVIWTFLPFFTYPEDSPVILSLRNENLVFDPGISTFHFSLKPVPFALPKDE